MTSSALDAPVALAPARSSTVYRRAAGFCAGLAAFAAVGLIPSPLHHLEGLGHRPSWAAATVALMVIWWFTEAIPIAATACLPLVLFPVFGVFGRGLAGDVALTAAPFVDAYVFLLLGGMAIGAAMEQCHLHRRIALNVMLAIGAEPKRLLLGVLVATASISLWISNTATAVMMLPIGMALLAQMEAARSGIKLPHYGAALMLAVAYASSVGGIGTKIGSGTNSLFVGFVADTLGYDITFVQYLGVGLPFVVLFIPVIWWVLWRLGRQDAPRDSRGKTVLRGELDAMGPMSRAEKVVAAVFCAAAALWVASDPLKAVLAPHVPQLWEGFRFQAKHYEAGVAMGAALLLIGVGALSRASIQRLPWSVLILQGGSFAMAAGIDGSGLSKWMAASLSVVASLPLLAQLALAAFATVGLSAVASNMATVTVMLTVLPRSLAVLPVTAMAASCDFALPAGTPPNAIVFGSGYVRLPTMMRTGAVLDLLAAALLTLYGWVYLPLLFSR